MDNKYLPIGSVCTLKGRKEKVMVIGLYSILLDNQIKVYDYKGCAFPKGLTLSNQLFSFNQEDIEKVEYRGYDNEEHKELLSLLADKLSKDEVNAVQSSAGFPQFSNFVFDENGYVIKADSSSTSNPFMNQVPIEEKEESSSIFRDIKFDENGTVIAADGKELEKTVPAKSNTSNYEFDENGTVIGVSSETPKEEAKNNNLNGIVFDENGTVIATDGKMLEEQAPVLKEKAAPSYQFDENGTVIADGNANNEVQNEEKPASSSSNYEFDENGVVVAVKGEQAVEPVPSPSVSVEDQTSSSEEPSVPDIEYEFDENGVIIGVKSQKE